MHKASPLLALTLATCVASDVGAMGFGRVHTGAVLGQPLRLDIPLQLQPDETLGPDCASAEVQAGDGQLVPANVRTTIEPGREPGERILRVSTLVAIDEPVITVLVSVGCPTRLSRRFTAFVDPPERAAAVPQEPPESTPLTPSAASTSTEPAAKPAPPRKRRAVAPTVASNGATEAASRRPARPAGPRLQLEASEPVVAPASAAADAQLLSVQAAASAAAEAASAAEARAAALDASLAQLRSQSEAQRKQIDELRGRLSARRSEGADSTSWLLALLVLLTLGAAWMGWRLYKLMHERRQHEWWRDAVAGQSDVAPPVAADPWSDSTAAPAQSLEAPRALLPSLAPQPAVVHVAPPLAPAIPVATVKGEDVASKRELSVEEHIDLEQQAEFFLVLGQEDAAIDLLLTHLRSTGGASPVPYLKLMRIYRARGDEESYERMRERFDQRFNARAPLWGDDAPQRSLDDYPDALAIVQHAWAAPLDAMAEIEAMLFRRGDGADRFDLPAYEELLFLYWLTRDLQQQQDAPVTSVDVLLPLDDGEAAAARVSAPMPMAGDGTPEADNTEPGISGTRRPDLPPLELDLDLDFEPPRSRS
jgi:hypothetical protein